MQAQLDEQRADFRLDQRAWIGVETIDPDPIMPEIGKPFTVHITIKNTGKTPAMKINSRGRGESIVKNSTANFSYVDITTYKAGFLTPGGTFVIGSTPIVDPQTNQSKIFDFETVNNITMKAITLYVHGRIDYNDIFGDQHWLTYCATLSVPFNGKFGFCDTHNDTDDYRQKHRDSLIGSLR